MTEWRVWEEIDLANFSREDFYMLQSREGLRLKDGHYWKFDSMSNNPCGNFAWIYCVQTSEEVIPEKMNTSKELKSQAPDKLRLAAKALERAAQAAWEGREHGINRKCPQHEAAANAEIRLAHTLIADAYR